MQNHTSNSFKKLLDKLQTESWQLELLISGFAIFGLFQAIDPIKKEIVKAASNEQSVYSFILYSLYPALTIVLIVLLVHVVLRGVWIGALGLRYVSGDIEYSSLNYSEKFTKHLQKKVGSFDRYISRLENICSALFAIAFLMAFNFSGLLLGIGIFIFIINLVELTGIFTKEQHFQFVVVFALLYFSLALLVFVDFIGHGGF